MRLSYLWCSGSAVSRAWFSHVRCFVSGLAVHEPRYLVCTLHELGERLLRDSEYAGGAAASGDILGYPRVYC